MTKAFGVLSRERLVESVMMGRVVRHKMECFNIVRIQIPGCLSVSLGYSLCISVLVSDSVCMCVFQSLTLSLSPSLCPILLNVFLNKFLYDDSKG